MSRLIFIRHAQASYMAEDYDNLSELGVEQSVALGQYLSQEGLRFDKVYTGPLKRHYQTFEHSFAQIPKEQFVEPIELDGLKEHSGPEALRVGGEQLEQKFEIIGRWKEEMGKNSTVHKRNSLRIFRLWMQEWMSERIVVDHPSVVPFGEWRQSVKDAMGTIVKNTGKNETIGVYTSGGTIGAILAEVLGIQDGPRIANFNDSTRNTSMTHFLYSSMGFNVLSFNEIPHLTREQITFV